MPSIYLTNIYFFLLFKITLITFAFRLTESQGFILVKGMAQMSLLGS